MGRKYASICKEDLVAQFTNRDLYDALYNERHHKLYKDLSKVKFDRENYDLKEVDEIGDFVFRWGYAGGDWEYGVNFIVYHDGKDFRGYIPKDGNTWCWTTKEAFGNHPEKEFDFLEKSLYDVDRNDEPIDYCDSLEDFDDMREEIKKRFNISDDKIKLQTRSKTK